ncbi:hypothetical protein NIES2104_30710 [Leptolyngbya sp. NIES-2104]|nr:hypothetical protein NIES2104_30710 [Leptolyngbya sp. NIES-2104]
MKNHQLRLHQHKRSHQVTFCLIELIEFHSEKFTWLTVEIHQRG